jgi:hypothetical protein
MPLCARQKSAAAAIIRLGFLDIRMCSPDFLRF